jgi:hypothetical protein
MRRVAPAVRARLLRLAAVLLMLAMLPCALAAKKKPPKWDEINFEALEKEWEEGDTEEELLTDDKLLMREMERRKKQQHVFDPK